MKNKPGFGVIGCGRIGKMHAENLLRRSTDVQFIAAADPFADSLQQWAESVGIPKLTADYRDVIDDPAIDAVVICSPTDSHVDYIIECARAGKHILCEKPISLDVKKTKEALSIVEKAGVALQIGFQRRFDTNAQTIHRAVASGEIGTVHMVRITSRDPAPPPISYIESSGGIFVDMMIHDLDMARFLAQSEISEVYATGACLVDSAIGTAGDIDTAIVTLKFENGALGVINNSREAVYGHDQRIEVFGSKGSAESDNRTEAEVVVRTVNGVNGQKPLWFFVERYKEAYVSELDSFLDSVTGGKPVPVNGTDGVNSVIVGLAAGESLRKNQPVTISEFEKQFR